MEMIKKIFGLALVAGLATAGSTFANEAAQNAKVAAKKVDVSKLQDGSVLAKVNGKSITFKDAKDSREALPAQLQNAPLGDILMALVNRLVDLELISLAAEKENIAKDPKVQQKIKECEKAVVQKELVERQIDKKLTNEMLREKYDELLKVIPKNQMEYQVSMILVKTEKEAKEALNQLTKANTSEKFREVAKEKSIDTSRDNGGSLGWLSKQDMKSLLPADAIAKAAKATTLMKVFPVEDKGFAIFRVDDSRKIPLPEFKDVEADLKEAMKPQLAIQIIQDLRKSSDVKFYDETGKEVKMDEAVPAAESKKEEANPAEAKKEEATKEPAKK